MYFLNGGVGTLEALRKPLVVNRASYERAKANLAFQPMADRIDPAKRLCWFRTKAGLDVPYWSLPEYRERERDPSAPVKSGLLYQPYWMTNKSRARLIQRPSLQIKPRSEVLVHLGTDEDTGLGKGGIIGKATKAIKKVVPKKVLKIAGNIATGGMLQVVQSGVDIAKGKPIVGALKSAVASFGPGGGVLTPIVGVDKSLMLQSVVAGGALTSAAAAGTLPGLVGKLAPIALAAGTKAVTSSPQAPSPLTPEQMADVSAGRAVFDPATGSLTYVGGFTPSGPAPWQPAGQPMDFGPPLPVQAGMFGDLSPLTIGLLIGVPLVFTLLTRNSGRR